MTAVTTLSPPKVAGVREGVQSGPMMPAQPVSSFLGREQELQALVDATLRTPSLVVVEGQAGVGKTRLVQEALEDEAAAQRHTLVGRSPPLREPVPLGAVIEALRGAAEVLSGPPLPEVAGALRPLLPELAQHLPPALEPLGDPTAERHRLFRGVLEVFRALQPLTCVLEDLHRADEATLDFLCFAVCEPVVGLALVLTYRREDLDPASPLLGLAGLAPAQIYCLSLHVQPLTDGEVGQLASSLLEGRDLARETIRDLHDWTGGIPLAVEQVIRLIAEQGLADIQDEPATQPLGPLDLRELGVPRALADSILHRVGLLPSQARRIIEAAAVLDAPSTEARLAEVAQLQAEATRAAVSRCLESGLLLEVEDGTYGLQHALAVEAVHQNIPTPRRRHLHLRAGHALEALGEPRPLARLAHHFREAGETGRWVHYAEAAARAASSVGDEVTASRLLEEAICAPGVSSRTRLRLAQALGPAALAALRPYPAINILQGLLEEESLEAADRGELRIILGWLLDQGADSAGGRREFIRALDDLDHNPRLATTVMAHLAFPWTLEGHLDEHLAWLDQAVAAAADQQDSELTATIHTIRAITLLSAGDPAGWQALAETAPDPKDQPRREIWRQVFLALSIYHLGHYQLCRHYLEQAQGLYADLDHDRWVPVLGMAELLLDWATGCWQDLEPRARELARAHPDTPASFCVGSHRVLGSLQLAQGRLHEARDHLAEVLDMAWKAGSVPGVAGAAAALARIHQTSGEHDQADEVIAKGLAVLRTKHIWAWAAELAPVAVERLATSGRLAEVQDLIDEFATGLTGRDAPAATAALAHCRGHLQQARGDHLPAVEQFTEAHNRWSRLPRPYDAARAREQQALCLLAADDPQGQQVLIEALQAFDHLGATWDVDRLKQASRTHDITLPYPWRGGRKSYGDELSPREQQVAHLAADGLTNREIATALFISPRTVEDHLAAARRKLGVASRHDLDEALNGQQEDPQSASPADHPPDQPP